MHTKQAVEKFYNDFEILGLKKPVAVISEKTGFGKSTVSQYLNRKKEPSENFLNIFYEKFDISSSGEDLSQTDASLRFAKKARQISIDKLSGVLLRTYALQQVSLSVLSELLAEKNGVSVTATQSELLKAVEAEELKLRDVLQS